MNRDVVKQHYVPPLVTVVSFKNERGFAESEIIPIEGWTGISIEQELFMLQNGEGHSITGDYTASSFSDGGYISGGNWATNEDGGWF